MSPDDANAPTPVRMSFTSQYEAEREAAAQSRRRGARKQLSPREWLLLVAASVALVLPVWMLGAMNWRQQAVVAGLCVWAFGMLLAPVRQREFSWLEGLAIFLPAVLGCLVGWLVGWSYHQFVPAVAGL